MEIGRFLKLCREINKLTLRQVEDEINVSNACLSQIETGKIKSPSFETVYLLCNLYNITMQTLINATIGATK